MVLVRHIEGATSLLKIDDLASMTEVASQNALVLAVFRYALVTASTEPDNHAWMKAKIRSVITSLLLAFKGTDGTTLLVFLSQITQAIPVEVPCLSTCLSEHRLTRTFSSLIKSLAGFPQWLIRFANW